jgi:hypothetical protein
MMRSAFLLSLLAGSYPILSNAQELLKIGKTVGGSVVYIDVGSIVKNGGKSSAWLVSIMEKPESSKLGGFKMSEKAFVVFDCVDRKISLKELYEYRDAKSSQIIGSPTSPHPDANSRFMAPVSGSTTDIAMRIACFDNMR